MGEKMNGTEDNGMENKRERKLMEKNRENGHKGE